MSGVTGVDGLASGIQTTEIVDAIIGAERRAASVQENRRELLEARLEAVRGFNTRMLGAQLDLSSLRSGSAFNGKSAVSSNETVLSASARSDAVNGTYNLNVTALAQAHQVATGKTQGEASKSSDLGAGSLTLQLGNGSPVTLNFAEEGSSLDNIAEAINNAGVGVSAFVIKQDGSEPYRLVMQSEDTGLASQINVSADGALTDLFAEANLETLSEAQDAELTLGTGAGAISFASADNEFADVVPGVTIQARSLGSSSLKVGTETAGAAEAIGSFVESLNGAIEYLRANTEVDPEGEGEAGILLSQTDLRRGLDRVIRDLFTAIPGLPQDLNNVTSIGFGLDRQTGHVTIDEDQLQARLASDPEGVARLFNNSGTSSEPGIEFASMTDVTDASSPLSVDITAAATQAQALGATMADTDTLEITSSNNGFALTVNGRAYTMSLAEGTYTRDQLVDHLQAVLDQELPNQDRIQVGVSGGQLALTTARYGSSASIAAPTASSSADLGFATINNTGSDVQGTINGEAAQGSGQILTGTAGAGEGLSLVVTASAPISGASMTITEGLGGRLGDRFNSLTDSRDGAITRSENSLSASIEGLTSSIAKVDERLAIRREGLLRQFRTMETLMAQFQSQQSFLEGQIAAFSGFGNNRGDN